MKGIGILWRAGLGAAAVALAACGGSDAPAPSGRTMAAPAQAAAGANQPPRIDRLALDPREPVAGQDVVARVQTVDPDGDAVELQYTWWLDGRRVGERGASLRIPETAGKDLAIEVEVVAHDGRAGSAPAQAQARVANRPPELLGVRIDPFEGVKVGTELVAVADARDPDGDGVDFHYHWRVNGRPVEARGERFSTADLKRGDTVQVRVVASDGSAETPPLDSAPVSVGNSAPAITSMPGGVSADGSFRYALQASDPDGDRSLRFRLEAGPEGARVDPVLGEVTWSASRDHVGKHAFEVVVQDGHGGEARQRFEVDVREVPRTAASAEDGSAASIE
jgi:hypothetical protein